MSLREFLHREVSISKALIAFLIFVILTVVSGSVIGYKVFWNQFDGGPYYVQRVRDYEQLLQQNPADVDAMVELGWALIKLGRFDEAKEYLSRALAINPNHAGAKYNRSLAYMYQGNYIEAEKGFRQLVNKYPKHELAWSGLGGVLIKQRKWEEALAAVNELIDLNPSSAVGYYFEGVALENIGDKSEALKSYGKALEYDPGYKEALKAKNDLESAGR